jgi:hypothetical protein
MSLTRPIGPSHRNNETWVSAVNKVSPEKVEEFANFWEQYAIKCHENNDYAEAKRAEGHIRKLRLSVAEPKKAPVYRKKNGNGGNDGNSNRSVTEFIPPSTMSNETEFTFTNQLMDVLKEALVEYMTEFDFEQPTYLRMIEIEDTWVLLKGSSVVYDESKNENVNIGSIIDGLPNKHPMTESLYFNNTNNKIAVAVDTTDNGSKYFVYAVIPDNGMTIRYFSSVDGKDVPICKVIGELIYDSKNNLWDIKWYFDNTYQKGYKLTEKRQQYRLKEWKNK